jgi:hypothetical protein
MTKTRHAAMTKTGRPAFRSRVGATARHLPARTTGAGDYPSAGDGQEPSRDLDFLTRISDDDFLYIAHFIYREERCLSVTKFFCQIITTTKYIYSIGW